MSSPYEIRSNDNGKSKKQSMAELKLRRLTELNQRLQEDLNRRRIPVSEAALECVPRCCPASVVDLMLHVWNTLLTSPSLIAFTDKEPKDFMVPSRWGTVSIRCHVSRPHKPLLTQTSPDRQARRPLRAPTTEWMLHSDVGHLRRRRQTMNDGERISRQDALDQH